MWYTKEIEEIFKKLKSSLDGLSNREATKRLKQNGKNELPKKKQDSILKIFLLQFKSPIIAILIIAIILSVMIGELIDASFILAVILINGILGTIQEYTAEKSAEKLQDMIRVTCKAIRDKKKTSIDSADLVVGDIILLESGDKIPADIRLIETTQLLVDESILTGESEGRVKNHFVLPEKTALTERDNMLYAGTVVLSGKGTGIVVETAGSTEIGKIADKVLNTEDADSPLVIRIAKFSKQLSLAFALFAAILSMILYYKHYPVNEIFFSIVALTVSAIPEGLSTAMTIALSISSHRMAKQKVIVKKLSAVESLGSCTVIASDKTGTLTVNEQTAKIIVLPWGTTQYIKGTGYQPDEKVKFDENITQEDIQQINLISKIGILNNDAQLKYENNQWTSFGDSIDIAFLTLGEKLNISSKTIRENNPVMASIPYESKEKYSAVYYQDEKDGTRYFTAKGSVERILMFCNKMFMPNGMVAAIDKNLILKQNETLASNGYRVIALAYGEKKKLENKSSYTEEDLPSMTFVGLVRIC